MKITSLIALGFAALVTASPAQQKSTTTTKHSSTTTTHTSTTSTKTSSSKTSSTSSTPKATHLQSFVATFDDITVAVAGTSLQPIGVYDNLEYADFNVIDIGAGVTGVTPQSSPNVATFGILTGGGTSGTLETTGNVLYFALKYFYFGCVVMTEESLASLPSTCSISVMGSRDGTTIATEDFTFTASGATLQALEKVTFNAQWDAVDEVVITDTSALAVTQAVIIDNVSYETFST